MTQITMPRLSDSMEQGTILSWLKNDGEHLEAGEDLLEIETDKATVTHAAEVSGTLQIIAPEGTTLPVDAPIARIGQAGGSPAAQPVREAPARMNGQIKATPVARRVAQAHGVSLDGVTGSGPLGRVTRRSSRRPRSPCAAIRARTQASATAPSSCTVGSTWASPLRQTTRSSSPPSSTQIASRSGRSPA